uniref:Uncharacterized protein n=1 Tax=viral metagenome TaxID=1070528 RepID=A0A6C0IYE2_9ZZZZ
MNSVVNNINTNLDRLFDNKSFTTVVSLLLALYAGLAAPALPNNVILFFDTLVGKVLMVFLIGYVASKNAQMAIMLAVAFVVTLNLANNHKLLESFEQHNQIGEEQDDQMDNDDSLTVGQMDNDDSLTEGQMDNDEPLPNEPSPDDPHDHNEPANISGVTEKFSSCHKDGEDHEDFQNQNIEPFVPSNNVFNSKDNLYAPY